MTNVLRGFLTRTDQGIAADLRDDVGYTYALVGVPAELDGRKGYVVEVRVVGMPDWAALVTDEGAQR